VIAMDRYDKKQLSVYDKNTQKNSCSFLKLSSILFCVNNLIEHLWRFHN